MHKVRHFFLGGGGGGWGGGSGVQWMNIETFVKKDSFVYL